MGVLYSVFGRELSGFFLGESNSEVVGITSGLLRIVALAMPALGLTMVMAGALRGAGDTRWPMVFTMVGMLGVRIPLTYLLCHSAITIWGTGITISGGDYGVRGAWLAMFIDIVFRCLLVLGRVLHGGWQRIEV
jgi:Na+-driven multidrug efflux pump